jgi:hypothetical protein
MMRHMRNLLFAAFISSLASLLWRIKLHLAQLVAISAMSFLTGSLIDLLKLDSISGRTKRRMPRGWRLERCLR